jgi:hypothetical protein
MAYGGLDMVCRSPGDAEPDAALLSVLEHSLAEQRITQVTGPARSYA